VLEFVLGSFDQPELVGQQLFRALRELDALGVQAVVVEGVSEQHEGLAVMNRIRKAASTIIQLTM
jgi:L-threonylcarbamoyladenylate synthase